MLSARREKREGERGTSFNEGRVSRGKGVDTS